MDGGSTAEFGINVENGIQDKSLSGKALPENWPQIISPDEETRIYSETLTGPNDPNKVEKLSFTLKNGNKELRYLAVQHIFGLENRNHGQFSLIKENFDSVLPQVVLYEGPKDNPISISEEDAYRYGEKAYLQYLVLEHNRNHPDNPIKMESCDLQPRDEPEEYRKNGFSNEEIAANEVLKRMYSEVKGIENTLGLTDGEREQKIEELQEKYDTNPISTIDPEFFTWVPRADGQEWTPDLIKAELQRLTSQPLKVDLDYLEIPRFKQMFDSSREFRDKYITKKIVKAVNESDKIMVVMGSSHAIREKPALEQFFN